MNKKPNERKLPVSASLLMIIMIVTIFIAKASLIAQCLPSYSLDEHPAVERERYEVWAYLFEGAESAYTGREPVTDLCYFRSIINYRGELVGAVPVPASVPVRKGTRTHLVVAELSNPALERIILSEKYKVRNALIASIEKQSAPFDGVQIDFESVPDDSREEYLTFLKDLKKKISPKMLSVAVPARTRYVPDAYDYDALSAVVDRIIIMAYDEHWSTSVPGPVASYAWCEKVVQYCALHIPKEKLVMGIPGYGRSWQSRGFSREISHADAVKTLQTVKTTKVSETDDCSQFEYTDSVNISVYYENERSILRKVTLYLGNGVNSFALWRLGQEPASMWEGMEKLLYSDKQ